MNLLVNQLKLAIRELLARKSVRARVEDKLNHRGEIVIGVILEKEPKDDDHRGGTCP